MGKDILTFGNIEIEKHKFYCHKSTVPLKNVDIEKVLVSNKISNNNRIKSFQIVEYLGCYLDANLFKESLAVKPLKKINSKLNFSYRQSELLNPKLRRLLSNFLNQPHFDYVCVSWYLLVSKKIRKKKEAIQHKRIRFCLKLNSRHHIGAKEFEKINWLQTKRKCRTTRCHKYF